MTETPILQGKVKSVYNVPGDAEKVTIVFHDKVTAWNGNIEHSVPPSNVEGRYVIVGNVLYTL